MTTTLTQIKDVIRAIQQEEDANFNSVSTDTRQLHEGDLFIALKGPHFDGHDFIEEAKQQGAAAVITHRTIDSRKKIPHLIVEDTHQALSDLAAFHRSRFKIPAIGITGSIGKTTVREMVASILRQSHCILSTQQNLNNTIGVPLAVLQLDESHEYAVIELGADRTGEIAFSTRVLQPHVAVITNAAKAHLAGFGSLESVSKAKGEILQGLHQQGAAVLNEDDRFCSYWKNLLSNMQRCITFGETSSADCYGEILNVDEETKATCTLHTPRGDIDEVRLPLPGIHQVINASIAAAVTTALNISLDDIRAGLETLSPIKGRLMMRRGPQGVHVLDDSYNAIPNAVEASLRVLAHFKGQRIAVLADMLELGSDEIRSHTEVGELAKQLNIDALYAYGDLSRHMCEAFGSGAYHFSSQDDLVAALTPLLNSDLTLLIKGSRSMHMEYVVAGLLQGFLDTSKID